MSLLLRKELRLLFPAWICALVTATGPLWVGAESAVVIFGAGILVLALAPFGQEMSYGTFGLLLAQPENRRHFWLVKAGLAAIAAVSAWAVLVLSWRLYPWVSPRIAGMGRELNKHLGVTALVSILAFTGGLWTTLLFRQVTTAFWYAALVPAIIYAVISPIFGEWSNFVLVPVLLIYALAGFWFARRLFLSAQDTAWSGGELSLSQMRGGTMLSFGFKKKRSAWVAALQKELQMQALTLVLVPCLVVLHLAVLAILHFFSLSNDKRSVLEQVWVFWLLVPLIIGCVAVAEERRHNTLESQLCLPLRKSRLFAVKFVVVMVLGTVFGGVAPFLLEQVGGATHFTVDGFRGIVLAAAAITGVAFYASTLSRTMIQALSTALGSFVVVALTVILFIEYVPGGGGVFRSDALAPSAWIAVIATFIWLAFRNYKTLQIGSQAWRSNFAGVGALFACLFLIPAGIYQRPWELYMTLEPKHGPARLSGTGTAKIAESLQGLCFLLPDGRLWVGSKDSRRPRALVRGSNWVDLASSSDQGTFGLKADGTLWAVIAPSDVRQIGTDTDWKEVAGGLHNVLGLKQNGTVWEWGNFDERGTAGEAKIAKIPNPIQISASSNWAHIPWQQGPLAEGVRSDGEVCIFDSYIRSSPRVVRGGLRSVGGFGPLHVASNQGIDSQGWNLGTTNWIMLSLTPNLLLGIRSDHSLWAMGEDVPSKIFGEDCERGRHHTPVRVGKRSNWLAASSRGYNNLVGLEADGTLWKSQFKRGSSSTLQSGRVSKYTDWVAATGGYGWGEGIWALTKDGTVCHWDNDSDWNEYILLRPSRRPASFNIFDSK